MCTVSFHKLKMSEWGWWWWGGFARAKFCPNIVLKSVSGWVGVWVYAIANFCSTLF